MDEWKNQLRNLFKSDLDVFELKKRQEAQALVDKRDADRFITNIAQPAFEEIKFEFIKYGKRIEVSRAEDCIGMEVFSATGFNEYSYTLKIEGRLPVVYTRSQLKDEKFTLLTQNSNRPLTIDDLSKQTLADHFVQRYSHYKKYFR